MIEVNEFPNGFESWQETHFEIAQSMAFALSQGSSKLLSDTRATYGHTGLYSLAKKWTDEFENKNRERCWDGEFYDEVDEFVNGKIKNKPTILLEIRGGVLQEIRSTENVNVRLIDHDYHNAEAVSFDSELSTEEEINEVISKFESNK